MIAAILTAAAIALAPAGVYAEPLGGGNAGVPVQCGQGTVPVVELGAVVCEQQGALGLASPDVFSPLAGFAYPGGLFRTPWGAHWGHRRHCTTVGTPPVTTCTG
jgi:hypothetical protein